MEPELLVKVESAVHTNLMAVVSGVAGAGMTPKSAIALVRAQLDLIETMHKEEFRETAIDVPVPGAGERRYIAEEWMETIHPEASAQHAEKPDGERGVRSPAERDNQAYYGPPPGVRSRALRPDVPSEGEGAGGW